MIEKLLNEQNTDIILKRSAVLNLFSAIVNAAFTPIILFFVTRIGGLNDAGEFSIASVFAYQCLTVGNFSSHNVQVADSKEEFSFSDFVYFRFFSVTLMYLLLFYFSFCSGYNTEKAMIIFTFSIFKSFDAIDDIFRAEYHRHNRLDIASWVMLVRYTVSLIVYAFVYYFTRNLIVTSIISAIITVILLYVLNRKLIFRFVEKKNKFDWLKFKQLMVILVPICVASYLKMYMLNIPKYAIDSYLTVEFQTYFNILLMPATMITLLAEVVFSPYIPKLSMAWENSYSEFKRLVFIENIIILIITLVTVFGGCFIGIKLLELLYNVKLNNYMLELIIVLLAGGLNAGSVFMLLVLTIQRRQKGCVFIYGLVTIIGIVISDFLVNMHHLMGACLLYFIICLLNYFFSVVLIVLPKKHEKL